MTAILSTDVAAVRTGLFLAGRWRGTASGASFDVVDPRTGKPLVAVADATVDDARQALDSAHRAQPGWAATTPRRRADILSRAYELVMRRSEQFASVIAAETGKPLDEARGEVVYGSEFLRWFAEQAAHPRGDYGNAPVGDLRLVTTRVPVGPSLLITPWNFPLAMCTRKVGAALAAGCTVILKPAEQTPLTAALLVEVLVEAGVDNGVVNLLPTTDASALSSALMSDSRLRKVSFTGSTAVGSVLLVQAAQNIIKSSMELGGNGPFLVLADADVVAAVDGALVAKFRNSGQSCVAANRFIVHRDIAEQFTALLAERTAQLASDRITGEFHIGPLIDDRQRRRVAELVAEAIEQGARVVCGGSIVEGPGYFYEPTVLADVPATARILHEEIFGPVAPITVVDSTSEAIAVANDTPYGLAAFVYTRDIAEAFTVAEQLEAGMVGINRGLVSEVAAPFGGIKASGIGREGGNEGIEEYLETKYYSLDLRPTTPLTTREGQGR